MKKGFTLIELLVVVLIIGVLTAIALPQYTKAVTKTRIAAGLPVGRGLMTALDEYYLAERGFTAVYDNLVLSVPPGFTDKNGVPYTQLKSTDAIYYGVGTANQKMYKLQSGGKVQYQMPLPSGKSVNIYFYSHYATADDGAYKGRIYCTGESNAKEATKYCELIGGVKDGSKYFLN